MKIYEIGTGYTPIPARMGAATEIVVEELTKAFLQQDQDVQIIDIAAENRAPHELPIREVTVPKCFSGTDVQLGLMHKLKRVVYSVALAGQLQKILKNADERVVLHFHNQYNLFFFLKLTPKKLREKAWIAYTVHSYIWPAEWDSIEKTVQKRYFQEIYSAQKADCVFVLNEKTKENFVRHLGVQESQISIIGNGVNTDVYRIMEEDAVAEFRSAAGFSGKQIIFQVGSVCDRKNQLGAITMLTNYLQKHRDVMYVYAGGIIDAEYQQKLIRHAQEQGIAEQVRYLGELSPGDMLNRYYNLADVTIFPSKIESFGLVIIESLAAGTPVILAEKPVFHLQEGYFVYHSEKELRNLADHCMSGLVEKEKIREEAMRFFSWEKIAADYLSVFKNEK